MIGNIYFGIRDYNARELGYIINEDYRKKGYATDTLLKRLGELEKQRNEINDSITKEKLKSPIFTQEHFKMALCNFRKIDITKQDGKRKIIDTFINSIFLYDDHLKIVYNGNGKEETITLDELESSTLFSQGAPKGKGQANACPFPFGVSKLNLYRTSDLPRMNILIKTLTAKIKTDKA